MNTQTTDDINQLLWRFQDLQDQWEDVPEKFDWTALRALAVAASRAYNEGSGSSFHILALDGVPHGEFHLRFLGYSLEAGFDPFKLVQAGAGGQRLAPVFGHESLAEAAQHNPWSARMQARLRQEVAAA